LFCNGVADALIRQPCGTLFGLPGDGKIAREEPGVLIYAPGPQRAQAALLAIKRAQPGIYNIAEDTGFVSITKARRELGWDPGFRLGNRQLEHGFSSIYSIDGKE
jgi:hypothetical protein